MDIGNSLKFNAVYANDFTKKDIDRLDKKVDKGDVGAALELVFHNQAVIFQALKQLAMAHKGISEDMPPEDLKEEPEVETRSYLIVYQVAEKPEVLSVNIKAPIDYDIKEVIEEAESVLNGLLEGGEFSIVSILAKG